ncbi:induced myeloid leukemia cell differentiation protein Mcl-1 homolog [Astyanax mexicanus]|uniref:induced myeloid leukemia cell differentiation protein Mcl-1 homolog n=1 Tax=Astyanax mexicanus TaxID=7994 RepID=UPI0020CB540C|nr:induced myeloid leukemia cell differentiation protein Mcl-1 homolog [Astyanax mexicanus]
MNPTEISLLCDGASPVLYRTEKEEKLPRAERPDRGLEGLQSAKHGIAYNGIVQKLNLEEQDDSMNIISSVAETIFSDGTTNWGRIVSLVAFGAVVCDHLKKKSRDHCVENVAQHISTYLNTHQHQWLINNNAWDGFVEFFREDDSDSPVRKALMAYAGFAWLGAGLALLI